MEFLQLYWWMLISILGGILVFLLFVQGGQSLLLSVPRAEWRERIVGSIGHKWELTYTTLVTFGGAAFASFPLFYSTSFGGAYWLWILILFTFVVQAVSYEYRSKPGNLLGEKCYDCFLFVNGTVGCILLGEAVATFFFGADFIISRLNIMDAKSPVISQWGNGWHGFDLIFNWRNALLGFAVAFLARTLGILYLISNLKPDEEFRSWLKGRLWWAAGIFLVFFLTFLGVLLTRKGLTVLASSPLGTETVETSFKYWDNLISTPSIWLLMLIGVGNVLLGIFATLLRKGYDSGIWFAGLGTFFTVVALFWMAGYNATPFLPSNSDPASSLTLANASSSEFTLRCMAWASLLIPFVIGYIWYVWRKMR